VNVAAVACKSLKAVKISIPRRTWRQFILIYKGQLLFCNVKSRKEVHDGLGTEIFEILQLAKF